MKLICARAATKKERAVRISPLFITGTEDLLHCSVDQLSGKEVLFSRMYSHISTFVYLNNSILSLHLGSFFA